MPQQQTKRRSGHQYHLNLDDMTYSALAACQQTYGSYGHNFSNSVIARRAIRVLLEKIEHMPSRAVPQEIVETKRAAKGVL